MKNKSEYLHAAWVGAILAVVAAIAGSIWSFEGKVWVLLVVLALLAALHIVGHHQKIKTLEELSKLSQEDRDSVLDEVPEVADELRNALGKKKAE